MGFASRLYSAFAVVSSADPEGFDWKGALVDAGIIAGLNFFSTLAGLGATGIIAVSYTHLTLPTICSV